MEVHIYRSKLDSWYPSYQRWRYDDDYPNALLLPRQDNWGRNKLVLFKIFNDGKYQFYIS